MRLVKANGTLQGTLDMHDRVTVILLVLFVTIVFAISFSHVLKEQPPAKKTTLVEEPAVEILVAA